MADGGGFFFFWRLNSGSLYSIYLSSGNMSQCQSRKNSEVVGFQHVSSKPEVSLRRRYSGQGCFEGQVVTSSPRFESTSKALWVAFFTMEKS